MLEVNVSHVHSQSACLRILFVLHNDGVGIQSLFVQPICVIHVSEIVEDIEGQIDVYLVKVASGLSDLSDLLFFGSSLFRFVESLCELISNLGLGRRFK